MSSYDKIKKIKFRTETALDYAGIRAVITDAFDQVDEADLVDTLRSASNLPISLVAKLNNTIVGHVGLSKLDSPNGSLALAPVSVSKDYQRKGVGSDLVRAAIEETRKRGFQAIFVVGAAEFYSRFGFSAKLAADFPCDYAGPHFMALQLTDAMVETAPVIYDKAFDAL